MGSQHCTAIQNFVVPTTGDKKIVRRTLMYRANKHLDKNKRTSTMQYIIVSTHSVVLKRLNEPNEVSSTRL